MNTLIIKLGATGDVVRTTTLLEVIDGPVDWLTTNGNAVMLQGHPRIRQCVPWQDRHMLNGQSYDLAINLEDSNEPADFLNSINYLRLFGAHLDGSGQLTYTKDAREWFDLSIISGHGKEKADKLKLENRKTYQELIFEGLGYQFNGEPYFIPEPTSTNLKGDIAIAPKSGSVWPMKNWSHFEELKLRLEQDGYVVNFLPERKTILEHIGDIKNHKYLISGDSLPMHIALGLGIRCLSIFICTSPWEIYDYGLQRKVISPELSKYFYRRDFEESAVVSISLAEVYTIVEEELTHLELLN